MQRRQSSGKKRYMEAMLLPAILKSESQTVHFDEGALRIHFVLSILSRIKNIMNNEMDKNRFVFYPMQLFEIWAVNERANVDPAAESKGKLQIKKKFFLKQPVPLRSKHHSRHGWLVKYQSHL